MLKEDPDSMIVESQHTLAATSSTDGIDSRSHYSRKFWARATTEHLAKINNISDPMMALIDHGSEINITSAELYDNGKWPINTRMDGL